jgi:hypothetical protein
MIFDPEDREYATAAMTMQLNLQAVQTASSIQVDQAKPDSLLAAQAGHGILRQRQPRRRSPTTLTHSIEA